MAYQFFLQKSFPFIFVADISDVKAMQLRPLLKNFQSFSVREKSALNIVKKITGKNGVCHIDPTLLLNKDEWQKISVKKIDKPYILYLM